MTCEIYLNFQFALGEEENLVIKFEHPAMLRGKTLLTKLSAAAYGILETLEQCFYVILF